MTTELVLIVGTVVAAFMTAGLIAWLKRPRHRPALAGSHGAPFEDMFAYTMYDDPC